MKENWRVIKNFEEYHVSDQGNIFSTKTGRLLTCHEDHKGYLRVSLYKDKKKRTFKVHRLVAETFLPNPCDLPEVDHIFGERKDNQAAHLRWVSKSENTRNTSSCKKAVSKYNGVDFHRSTGKWRAGVFFNGKSKYLGLFAEETSAAKAFNLFCVENNLNRELNIIVEV